MRDKRKETDAMAKQRVNISLDEDTLERLRLYAWENHATVSKAVTDLVWSAKVRNQEIRGQMVLERIKAKR